MMLLSTKFYQVTKITLVSWLSDQNLISISAREDITIRIVFEFQTASTKYYPFQPPGDSHSSKNLKCRLYLFSYKPFWQVSRNFFIFLLIWANMDYVQLYIPRLNQADVSKSPAHVDLALVTSLNASKYSNGSR